MMLNLLILYKKINDHHHFRCDQHGSRLYMHFLFTNQHSLTLKPQSHLNPGTEVAIEAADMVLIRSNLHDLVVALDLARVVFTRIKWNFMWALLYNVLAVPYAAGIWFPWTRLVLPPQYAGLSMAASSVSVVLSSMALWLYKRPAYLNDEKAIQRKLSGSILQRANRLVHR